MFKLNEILEVGRRILKCGYKRYSPSEISAINTAHSQIHIKIPREVSVIFLINKYLDLNFDVLHADNNNRYGNYTNLRLNNLGAIGLFSNYKLTTSSGKKLEDIIHAHFVGLEYKQLKSCRSSDDFVYWFQSRSHQKATRVYLITKIREQKTTSDFY